MVAALIVLGLVVAVVLVWLGYRGLDDHESAKRAYVNGNDSYNKLPPAGSAASSRLPA